MGSIGTNQAKYPRFLFFFFFFFLQSGCVSHFQMNRNDLQGRWVYLLYCVCRYIPKFEQFIVSSETSKQCGTLSQCRSEEMHMSSEHFQRDPRQPATPDPQQKNKTNWTPTGILAHEILLVTCSQRAVCAFREDHANELRRTALFCRSFMTR